jgi:hypothetical protein
MIYELDGIEQVYQKSGCFINFKDLLSYGDIVLNLSYQLKFHKLTSKIFQSTFIFIHYSYVFRFISLKCCSPLGCGKDRHNES